MLGISDIINHNSTSRTLQTNERKVFFSNMPDCNTFRFGTFIVGTGIEKNARGRGSSRIESSSRSGKLLYLRPTLKNQVTLSRILKNRAP